MDRFVNGLTWAGLGLENFEDEFEAQALKWKEDELGLLYIQRIKIGALHKIHQICEHLYRAMLVQKSLVLKTWPTSGCAPSF